ncbi:MAG: SRPBCC domain-containing protein, partial [Acidobacteriota bacterium]
QIEEMTPPSKFSYRWLPGAVVKDPDPNTTLVTFTLEEVPEGTRVTVLETGFEGIALEKRAKAFQENTDGWRGQFENLERHLGQHA